MKEEISAPLLTDPIIDEAHSETPVAGEPVPLEPALNEFHELDPTVKSAGDWASEMVRSAADSIKDLFIAKHAQEFANFEEEKMAISLCQSTFATLCRTVEDRKQTLEQTKTLVGFYKGAKFPESIFKSAEQQDSMMWSLQKIAQDFAGGYILSIFGDKIIEEAAKYLAESEKHLAGFKRENAGILKQIRLI